MEVLTTELYYRDDVYSEQKSKLHNRLLRSIPLQISFFFVEENGCSLKIIGAILLRSLSALTWVFFFENDLEALILNSFFEKQNRNLLINRGL